jgi:hypothetical protein
MNSPIPIIQGAAWSGTVTVADSTEATVTTYLSSAWTPTVKVWGGQDQTPWTIEPTASWKTDGSDGLIDINFSASATATQEPAIYTLEVDLSPIGGGDKVPVFRGQVEIIQASGTATVPPTYATYKDLLFYWPNLAVINSDINMSGCHDHLGKAREWLDRVILAHDRPNSTFYVANGTYQPSNIWGGLGPAGTNIWLKQQLDANLLMVTPLVVEICSYRALGTILSSAIGADGKESPYERHGRNFLAKANEKVGTYIAELDQDSDGWPDYWVPCGTVSQRRY